MSLGHIVLIKGEEKHRGKWNIGMVDNFRMKDINDDNSNNDHQQQ